MYSVLHLGISYACNMRCEHCFVKRKKDQLTREKITNIIDDLCEQGLLMVYYTYGEPLLSKDFFPISEHVAKKGLVQILMTNGSLLSDESAKRIKEIGISNVYISIDSAEPEEHDCNRKYEGAFYAAIAGIRLMKKYGIHVGISCTVTEKNARSLKKIYDLALVEGVEIISFLRERNNKSTTELKKDSYKEYVDFFKTVIKQKDISFKFHDPSFLPLLKGWHDNGEITDLEYEKYKYMNSCHKHNTICLAPDGTVCRCNLIGDIIGNVNDTSVDDLIKE